MLVGQMLVGQMSFGQRFFDQNTLNAKFHPFHCCLQTRFPRLNQEGISPLAFSRNASVPKIFNINFLNPPISYYYYSVPRHFISLPFSQLPRPNIEPRCHLTWLLPLSPHLLSLHLATSLLYNL